MNRDRAIRVRGRWPGPVILRSGWSKAHARPYNDDLPEAGLRLERGSPEFLTRCADWLVEQGVAGVRTGPLDSSSRRPWEQAGFQVHEELALLERPLDRPAARPTAAIREGEDDDWETVAAIDAVSFDVEWRIGRSGLAEAATATPASRFVVAEVDDRPVGFAISGAALQVSYLQRLAVLPDARGRGIGRSLTADALGWAMARGARTMLLNTQPDNRAAIALYRSEGFSLLPERLAVLRLAAEDLPARDPIDGT
jgi:ribosomal protein S18 acetylase RimI-like enzyme